MNLTSDTELYDDSIDLMVKNKCVTPRSDRELWKFAYITRDLHLYFDTEA